MRKAARFSHAVWAVLSVVGILTVWTAASRYTPFGLLPSPWAVAKAVVETLSKRDPEGGWFYIHIGITVLRVFASFIIAIVLGTVIGLAMGLGKWTERAVAPILPIWMSFPTLLVVFLTILWFGRSEVGAIAAMSIVCTPYVVVSVWAGAAAMDKGLLQMAMAYRARRALLIRTIYLPQLLPSLFSSFRYAFSFGWKLVALFEAFGLKLGIGYQLSFWFEMQQVDKMLAWVVIFGAIMFLLEYGLLAPLERRAFAWRDDRNYRRTGAAGRPAQALAPT